MEYIAIKTYTSKKKIFTLFPRSLSVLIVGNKQVYKDPLDVKLEIAALTNKDPPIKKFLLLLGG